MKRKQKGDNNLLKDIGGFLADNGAWIMALIIGGMFLMGFGMIPMVLMGLAGILLVGGAKTALGASQAHEAPSRTAPPPRRRERGAPQREQERERRTTLETPSLRENSASMEILVPSTSGKLDLPPLQRQEITLDSRERSEDIVVPQDIPALTDTPASLDKPR